MAPWLLVAALPWLVGWPLPAIASADPVGHVVPLTTAFRRCDFTANTYVAAVGTGSGSAIIVDSSPATVAAEIHLATARPDSHYDVRLIQFPRPSSTGCGVGDPGIAAAGLDTDASGSGMTTIADIIRAGATGAWVFISIPDEYDQTPAESYTSDFVAPI
jgi:hypothetical protein